MKKKIGGCVVLFNPDVRVINNIAACQSDFNFDFFIIIDNSPEQNSILIDAIKQLPGAVIYKWMEENKGIAKALNVACKMAIENNCEWLLTMDQDSKFREGDLLKMIESIEEIES